MLVFFSGLFRKVNSAFFISASGFNRLYPTRQTSGQQSQKSQSGGGVLPGGVSSSGSGMSSRTGFLRRSNNSKTSKGSSTSTNAGIPNYQQQNANFANYQNCTIVRSHTPHANYGYVKVAPKILIFPIFVQPLDLCSRTLTISEELILHESKHHSSKVTVFVYSDLMLVTRETEPGRCNVLQSPLFLRHLRLQDDYAEELRFYLIHMTEKCDCLLSLEAYSADQKHRVCQCLKDNIDKQLQLHRREPLVPFICSQRGISEHMETWECIYLCTPSAQMPRECHTLPTLYCQYDETRTVHGFIISGFVSGSQAR
uniref:Si:ch211-154e10.1 n=1 Tax=Oryzias sinensis TaxID=183150 RepID=A0A8C7YL26_9TELE